MRITGPSPGMSFYVTGSDDEDALLIRAELESGQPSLQIPVQALPWRDGRLLERHGRRSEYGCGDDDPVGTLRRTLKGPQVAAITDIEGAELLELENGIATVQADKDSLSITCLRLTEGAILPAAVRVVGARRRKPRGAIHVAQLSGGRRFGGVTIEFGWEKQDGAG